MFLFNKKNKKTLKKDPVNLDKGLYVGKGVRIKKEKNYRMSLEDIYLDWGSLAGHTAVYGTTRVGKTRLMVSMIRQCIQKGHNILIIEPKGSIGQETIAWILEFLEEAGRLNDYKYISPLFKDFSMAFNPLWGLTNAEIASLIQSLIVAKESFYSDMGYAITFAMMLGLEFLEKAEGSEKINKLIAEEYKRVYNSGASINKKTNIGSPDIASRAIKPNMGRGASEIDPPYRSLVTFEDIGTFMTQEGLQSILNHVQAISPEEFNVSSDEEFEELVKLQNEAIIALKIQAEKDAGYFSKVGSSFSIAVQQLSSGDIGHLLCSVKINPLMDGYKNQKKGQVVVVQPYPLKYKRASDAFVRVFFAMFTTSFGDIGAAGRAFPREIFLFIDEGGSVLYPGVEALFNKAGGLGLRIMIFTQSFADYEAELGKDVSKIVNDNTNTKIYMKMNDSDSRRIISESFGRIKTKESSYQASKLDMRVSINEREALLLNPSFIADLDSQEFLLQNKNGAFLCKSPIQYDPKNWVEMPITAQEELYSLFSKTYEDHEKIPFLKNHGGK